LTSLGKVDVTFVEFWEKKAAATLKKSPFGEEQMIGVLREGGGEIRQGGFRQAQH
jgi:hypothetical protein